MRTYQHPIYQDNTMAIRAEYDEEKRVFDLMKKFLYIVGAITAIVVFLLLLVNSPALITQTGAIGIIALVPVLLAATAFTGFYRRKAARQRRRPLGRCARPRPR